MTSPLAGDKNGNPGLYICRPLKPALLTGGCGDPRVPLRSTRGY